MNDWELLGALTFIICFAALVLFLSWNSRNDGGFGSRWFPPDNGKREANIDKKNAIVLVSMLVFVVLILIAILF